MKETKPRHLIAALSIAYGDFRGDFREVRTDEGFLFIADSWLPIYFQYDE